jgi:transmembrane secretion effector
MTTGLRRPLSRFPVLGIRNFQLLLIDRLLATAAYGFSLVGVSFAVLRTTGSIADLSYVLAAQLAPSLVFALLGGVAADRFPPQLVIIVTNFMITVGEGTFGLLMLTGRPSLWVIIMLEMVTGTGTAAFYPASQALLPRLVPDRMLQDASVISRLAMNAGQMGGAAVAGVLVAAAGPGWALTICSAGMVGTVPVLLSLRPDTDNTGGDASAVSDSSGSLIVELRAGWSEFRSRTWLWVFVAETGVAVMAWYGAFMVLGPVVARARLGGPAAWGTISAADAVGWIVGGLVSLRITPRRPMLFAALLTGALAISPLSLGLMLPLPVVCLASFAVGVLLEMTMVQWTVALARNVPRQMLARVSSYDYLGSVGAMPLGALLAGPLATAFGVSPVQLGAAGLIVLTAALSLLPHDIRTMRNRQAGEAELAGVGG